MRALNVMSRTAAYIYEKEEIKREAPVPISSDGYREWYKHI